MKIAHQQVGLVAFDVLQAMIESDVMLTTKQISKRAGYLRWEVDGTMRFLRERDLVRRFMPKFSITERGRLAWALEAARRNRSAAKRRGRT